MVHAADRPAAIDRLRRALDETEVAGIQTTLPFHRFVARHPGFRAGDLSTDWVAEHWDGAAERAAPCPGGGRGCGPARSPSGRIDRGRAPTVPRHRAAPPSRARPRPPGRPPPAPTPIDRWPA